MWKLIVEKTFAADTTNPGIVPPNLAKITKFKTLEDLLIYIPEMLIGLVGVVFLGMFFLGGYQYLTSMGNEEQSKQSKETLLNAVIGLAIVLIAAALVRWIKTKLGFSVIF